MTCVQKVVIGDATLHLGDCMDVLPTLGKVDCIITDPPYGISFSHSGHDVKGIGGGKYKTAFGGVKILGDDMPFDPSALLALNVPSILFGGNHYADKLPPSPYWLIWDKREAESTLSFADCEMAWTNLAGNARIFRHYWNGMLKASERGIPRVHPTQKPIELMKWCIEKFKDAPKTILDPFMGSGTTGVAAIQLGRKFIGIEREPKYFKIACERIEQAYAQGQLFEPVRAKQEQEALI